jgi:hypothetical protein
MSRLMSNVKLGIGAAKLSVEKKDVVHTLAEKTLFSSHSVSDNDCK